MLVATGGWALSMRGMMVTTQGEDYVTFAEAKGLRSATIFLRYCVQNALLPQATGLALALGQIVSGAVLVEVIFGYPGIGTVLFQAIRENGDRASACGYNVNRIKHLSFVFSATFAGLAGGLDALRLAVVPVESLYWTTSGQVVIMTLLGGAGTFFGPFVGAGTYLVLEDRLAAFIESWPLVIGLIFMAFVLFLPRGIWGTLVARLPTGRT